MAKIIVEHSGTEYYNELAQDITTALELNHGCDVEQMIGEENQDLELHWQPEGSNDLIFLASMKTMPSEKVLEYYIRFGTT